MRREEGFTLIELLVAMALSAVLLSLAAGSVRHFALVQALEGAVDEVRSELRRAQSRSVSESRFVYGAWFERGSSRWRLVRFDADDPTTTADDTCTAESPKALATGMFSTSVRISADPTATAFPDSHETTICRSKLLNATAATNQFVFFYARGTATPGKVTIEQPALGRSRVIDVRGLTGRVDAA